MMLSTNGIIPLSRAQRTLGRLRFESRDEVKCRMQNKNERVTSRLFLPGVLKSYNRAWRSDARKLDCPRLPALRLGERWGHFRAFAFSTPAHLGHKGDRNSRQRWAIIKIVPLIREFLLFCSLFLRDLNTFQAGNG